MKKVKKQVKLNFSHVNFDPSNCNGRYEYVFTSHDLINHHNPFEILTEVDEPETMKEFCEMHNMPKKVVVEWLNKNFKKQ